MSSKLRKYSYFGGTSITVLLNGLLSSNKSFEPFIPLTPALAFLIGLCLHELSEWVRLMNFKHRIIREQRVIERHLEDENLSKKERENCLKRLEQIRAIERNQYKLRVEEVSR